MRQPTAWTLSQGLPALAIRKSAWRRQKGAPAAQGAALRPSPVRGDPSPPGKALLYPQGAADAARVA
jgi:hypothetical protein